MSIREPISKYQNLTYSLSQIDEAHERSIYTDLLLGILKKLPSEFLHVEDGPDALCPGYAGSDLLFALSFHPQRWTLHLSKTTSLPRPVQRKQLSSV